MTKYYIALLSGKPDGRAFVIYGRSRQKGIRLHDIMALNTETHMQRMFAYEFCKCKGDLIDIVYVL
jgi:hypothetical protein